MNKNKWFLVIAMTVAIVVHFHSSRTSAPVNPLSKEIEAEMPSAPPANRSPASKNRSFAQAAPSSALSTVQGERTLKEDVLAVLAAYDQSIDWNFHQDGKETIFSIFGGVIPHILDSQPRTLAFARSITEALGHKRDEIFLDGDLAALNQNPNSTTYNFKQQFEGYEVYNSYLRLFGRKEDGGVYYINNELKNVGQPALDFRVSQVEAVDALRSLYQDRGLLVEESSSKPVLFVMKPGVSELAWKVIVRVKGNQKDRREILISANTATVLQNESLLILN